MKLYTVIKPATSPSMLDPFSTLTDEIRTLSSGRTRLIAVSKKQSLNDIRELYREGCRDFGENYVQEWLSKKIALSIDCPQIRWHFIGRLQGNKLADLVGEVALIHSLSSLDHAKKINALAQKKGRIQEALIQLNLADESTKNGLSAMELPPFLEAVSPLPNLKIKGLMTFPPFSEDPETTRPFFRKLRELQRDLLPESDTELSMGVSGDYRIAIEEGATLVRLGTILFGAR